MFIHKVLLWGKRRKWLQWLTGFEDNMKPNWDISFLYNFYSLYLCSYTSVAEFNSDNSCLGWFWEKDLRLCKSDSIVQLYYVTVHRDEWYRSSLLTLGENAKGYFSPKCQAIHLNSIHDAALFSSQCFFYYSWAHALFRTG